MKFTRKDRVIQVRKIQKGFKRTTTLKTSNGCEGRVQGNMTRSLIITLITRVVTFHNFRISKVRLACRQNYSELGGDMSKLHVIGKM